MHVRILAAAGALVLAAGCGSTVEQTTTLHGTAPGAGQPSGGAGLTAPSGGAIAPGGASPGAGALTGAAVSSAPGGASAGTGAGGAGGSYGGAAASGASGRNGPGVTATTINVGVTYCTSCAAADQAVGAAGAAPSYDYRNVFDAVANYANAHGGFAGRKLQPIYYNQNVAQPAQQTSEAECATWTQDHKVFALFASQNTDDIVRTCAEKAGAISVGAESAEIGPTFTKYPHYVDLGGVGLDQLAGITVRGLARARYFTGKFGLVTWDDPAYHYAVSHGYYPALQAVGVKVLQTAYITVPADANSLADSNASVSSAVTKFRAMGIDHVIVQDGAAGVFGGGGLTLEWMNQAKSQHYYPRYGQNFENVPGWSIYPSDEMNNAIAVDQNDLDRSRDADWHINSTREHCYQIEASAGYPVKQDNINDELAAASACDLVFMFQRLMKTMSLITADAFMAGVNGLGTSYPSSEVYGTKFAPSLHGGGGMVRTEEYFASCQCLHYLTAPYYAD